jgi:hypothetical protein
MQCAPLMKLTLKRIKIFFFCIFFHCIGWVEVLSILFIRKTGNLSFFSPANFFFQLSNKIVLLLIRPTFASQITSGVALAEARSSNFKDTKHSLFVMLRRYRGLRSGYGVTNKSVSYEPFKLSLTFREAPPDENCTSTEDTNLCKNAPSVNSSMLLVISATPVKSVYKSK